MAYNLPLSKFTVLPLEAQFLSFLLFWTALLLKFCNDPFPQGSLSLPKQRVAKIMDWIWTCN